MRLMMDFDGLLQGCGNASALEIELMQSCTKLSP